MYPADDLLVSLRDPLRKRQKLGKSGDGAKQWLKPKQDSTVITAEPIRVRTMQNRRINMIKRSGKRDFNIWACTVAARFYLEVQRFLFKAFMKLLSQTWDIL